MTPARRFRPPLAIIGARPRAAGRAPATEDEVLGGPASRLTPGGGRLLRRSSCRARPRDLVRPGLRACGASKAAGDAGQVVAGLPLGGPLQPDASPGAARGPFFDRREIHIDRLAEDFLQVFDEAATGPTVRWVRRPGRRHRGPAGLVRSGDAGNAPRAERAPGERRPFEDRGHDSAASRTTALRLAWRVSTT